MITPRPAPTTEQVLATMQNQPVRMPWDKPEPVVVRPTDIRVERALARHRQFLEELEITTTRPLSVPSAA